MLTVQHVVGMQEGYALGHIQQHIISTIGHASAPEGRGADGVDAMA
jgi:hypothetical protein